MRCGIPMMIVHCLVIYQDGSFIRSARTTSSGSVSVSLHVHRSGGGPSRLWILKVINWHKALGSLQKKKIAYFETMSQLNLPAPPLSPIETILIETILVLVDPSPPSLQLRHIIFSI